MKISLTLPTLFPTALERTIANIRATSTNELEVLVVSPFQPAVDNDCRVKIVWIKEEERRGCATAHHEAMLRATGDLILAWVDDHLFVDGWDVKVLQNFVDREKRFHGGENGGLPGQPFAVGLRHVPPIDHIGTVFGIYYPYFPLLRLGDARRLGWFSRDFRTSSFGDCDLGLRIWSAGGRCEFSRDRLIQIHDKDNEEHKATSEGECFTERWNADMKLFVQRWQARYGNGWDTAILRGFNLDFCPEAFPDLVKDFSCRDCVPDMLERVKVLQSACLVESVGDVNVVWCGGKYHTVPQSLGPIQWSDEQSRANPQIKLHDTLARALRYIGDSKRRGHHWWHPRRWRSELSRLKRMIALKNDDSVWSGVPRKSV